MHNGPMDSDSSSGFSELWARALKKLGSNRAKFTTEGCKSPRTFPFMARAAGLQVSSESGCTSSCTECSISAGQVSAAPGSFRGGSDSDSDSGVQMMPQVQVLQDSESAPAFRSRLPGRRLQLAQQRVLPVQQQELAPSQLVRRPV